MGRASAALLRHSNRIRSECGHHWLVSMRPFCFLPAKSRPWALRRKVQIHCGGVWGRYLGVERGGWWVVGGGGGWRWMAVVLAALARRSLAL